MFPAVCNEQRHYAHLKKRDGDFTACGTEIVLVLVPRCPGFPNHAIVFVSLDPRLVAVKSRVAGGCSLLLCFLTDVAGGQWSCPISMPVLVGPQPANGCNASSLCPGRYKHHQKRRQALGARRGTAAQRLGRAELSSRQRRPVVVSGVFPRPAGPSAGHFWDPGLPGDARSRLQFRHPHPP
jgi:hypothetical protein